MLLDELKNISDIKQNVLKDLKDSKQKILIYGAAETAKRMLNMLTKQGLNIEGFFVDDIYWKENLNINNIPVYSTTSVMNTFDKFDTVIGFFDYKRAKETINDKAFQDKGKIFYFEERELFDYKFLNANLNEFQETYNWLSDQESKEIFIAYLKARLTGYPDNLINHYTTPQYFTELIKLSDEEIFVDCGAYTGDTLEYFLKLTANKYKKFYAFEPEKDNFDKLNDKAKNNTNIICIKKGVWNKKTTLKFSSDAAASSISNDGDIQVEVDSIDETVNDDKITFIKMDIEGSELKALEGAQNTIKRCMPKLAICVYHKKEDLIEIPQFIKQLESKNDKIKYDLYLRHHSLSSAETVLYAIPTTIKD